MIPQSVNVLLYHRHDHLKLFHRSQSRHDDDDDDDDE